MKTKLLTTAIILSLMIGLSACKKKEQPQPEPEPTAKELLTVGEWSYTLMEAYDDMDNLLGNFPQNMKFEFTTSGNYYIKDNTGAVSANGTYSVNENADPKTISFIPNGGSPFTLEIMLLNNTEMKLKESVAGGYFLHHFSR